MSLKTRTGTCDGCGKKRKLTKPADRTQEVMYDAQGRRLLLSSAEHAARHKQLIHYYWLCSECFPKVNHQDDIAKLRKEREPKERKARFAYPIIGGPLDGEYATTDDFYPERGKPDSYYYRPGGLYGHLDREYAEFNAASGGNKKLGGSPTMVFIHKSLLKPLISPRDR
jgi:hypothetical protein